MQTTTTEQTVRIIYHCTRCNHRWTHDYYEVLKGWLYRDTEGRHSQPASMDKECPFCRWNVTVKASRVKGQYSEKHECGPACLNAISPACKCQCGGANHGSGYAA